jgi:uncharacterized glyoxalase superfamily protein PhnB
MKNRSVPVDTVLPHLYYRDLAGAIEWLKNTFGFIEHYRYGDPAKGLVDGAQLRMGNAYVMVSGFRGNRSSPAEAGIETQSLTIFLDDVDAHYRKVKATGARLTEQLHETVYGELQYGVLDVEGHAWLFSQHAKDLSPTEWGATIAKPRF